MWLNVAFIVCVFGVLIYKPERIASHVRFKVACYLFALSLIVATVSVLFPNINTDVVPPSRMNVAIGLKLAHFASVLLFAVSFIAAATSLMPKSSEQ